MPVVLAPVGQQMAELTAGGSEVALQRWRLGAEGGETAVVLEDFALVFHT